MLVDPPSLVRTALDPGQTGRTGSLAILPLELRFKVVQALPVKFTMAQFP
jgi:hypothetical protein